MQSQLQQAGRTWLVRPACGVGVLLRWFWLRCFVLVGAETTANMGWRHASFAAFVEARPYRPIAGVDSIKGGHPTAPDRFRANHAHKSCTGRHQKPHLCGQRARAGGAHLCCGGSRSIRVRGDGEVWCVHARRTLPSVGAARGCGAPSGIVHVLISILCACKPIHTCTMMDRRGALPCDRLRPPADPTSGEQERP